MIRRARRIVLPVIVLAANAAAAALHVDMPGASIPIDVAAGYARATLSLSAPDGHVVQSSVDSGADRFKLDGLALVDGQYHYRIDFATATVATRAGSGADGRTAAATPTAVAPAPVEGAFRVVDGKVFVAASPGGRLDGTGALTASGVAAPADTVTPGNLSIQGSACVGLGCADGESYGLETLRLKEDNTRLRFFDTSTAPGYAATNWQLTANESDVGGLNKFSLEDLTAGRVPVTVLAGAPNNALYVSNNGKVGFRTSTPGLDLHMATTDTPAIRFEQTSGGAFVAQTWDIGANEANFFVRDLTAGSRLSFRIRPGAPTSSLDIAASGAVGVGTDAPGARLDVVYKTPLDTPVTMLRVRNTDGSVNAGQQDRFVVDSAGNVLARGTISQLSSRSAKENFTTPDGRTLLAKLEAMPVPGWNYRGAPAAERHIGPVAEDFHAAFGLGASNRYIAPADEAGVALASVKALQEEVKARDRRIEELEQRLNALEARLDGATR